MVRTSTPIRKWMRNITRDTLRTAWFKIWWIVKSTQDEYIRNPRQKTLCSVCGATVLKQTKSHGIQRKVYRVVIFCIITGRTNFCYRIELTEQTTTEQKLLLTIRFLDDNRNYQLSKSLPVSVPWIPTVESWPNFDACETLLSVSVLTQKDTSPRLTIMTIPHTKQYQTEIHSIPYAVNNL